MNTIETTAWFPAPGYYACLPELPAPHNEPHWHPETHPAHHRMGKPPRTKPLERHCLERGCSYLERRSVL